MDAPLGKTAANGGKWWIPTGYFVDCFNNPTDNRPYF
jgi:hypothetical protein